MRGGREVKSVAGTVVGQPSGFIETSAGHLAPVALGPSYTQRVGRRIRVRNVRVAGSVAWLANASQTTVPIVPYVHVGVLLDRQTKQGAPPAYNQIWIVNGGSAGEPSQPNPLYDPRFFVLAKRKVSPPATALHQNANGYYEFTGPVVPFEFDLPMDLSIQWSGSTADITDVLDNSLHFFAMQSTASGCQVSITYTYRTDYFDE